MLPADPSPTAYQAARCPLLELESADGEQRSLQALLHWVAADATGPATPICDVNVKAHLGCYARAMMAAMPRGWQPQHSELALVLLAHASGSCVSESPELDLGTPGESFERQLSALALLSQPDSARSVRRQLAEVAAAAAASVHPPAAALPSLEQLHYGCHRTFVRTASNVFSDPLIGSLQMAAALLSLHAQMAGSCQALLALQPENPNSWLLASNSSLVGGALDTSGEGQVLAVECLLRGAELAQQQRADVAFSICACNAAIMVATRGHAVPANLAEQALAVASEAAAATKWARRLLPASWVEPMQPLLQAVQHMLAAASGQHMPPGEANRLDVRAVMHEIEQAPNCAGCGKWAAGLRRCSRCKAVSYCRRVLAAPGCGAVPAALLLPACLACRRTSAVAGCMLASEGGPQNFRIPLNLQP